MKKVRTWAFIFIVITGLIWMTRGIINFNSIDGEIDRASPWYDILGNFGFATASILTIIYTLNSDEHKDKKGNWWIKLLILLPVLIIVTAIIDIVNL